MNKKNQYWASLLIFLALVPTHSYSAIEPQKEYVLTYDYYDFKRNLLSLSIGALIGTLTGAGCRYSESLSPLPFPVWWLIWMTIRGTMVETVHSSLYPSRKISAKDIAIWFEVYEHEQQTFEEKKEDTIMRNSAWILDWITYLYLKIQKK